MTDDPTGPPRHVVLLGPTASGKSSLALELAKHRGEAELVSVDSMSVYRGLDIGTAKPSPAKRALVPHHLIDVADPSEEFTLRQFQDAAREAISLIEARGHRALLVAGTALYLRAIVDDLALPGRWPELKRELELRASSSAGLESLYAELSRLDPEAASYILPGNKRRVVRALEVTIGSGKRFSAYGPGLRFHPPTRFVLVGIRFEPVVHDVRIEKRMMQMLDAGLLDEVVALLQRPGGLSRTARQALAYRELLSHVEDGVPLDEAVAEALKRTKAFARRQWRWFRRDPRIIWLDSSDDSLTQLLRIWDGTTAEAETYASAAAGRSPLAATTQLRVGD